jgi:formylglycine-generating enzyme required for sulfatase activity/cytochrome c2
MIRLVSAALLVCAAFTALAARADTAPAKPIQVFRDCKDCPGMIVIPPGSFEMGSTKEERIAAGIPEIFGDQESPQHHVTIAKPFAMSRTEITRGLYAEFVKETGHPDYAPGCAVHNAKTDVWSDTPGYSWRNPGFEQTDDHPVMCVNWGDNIAFTEWLSKKTGKHYRLASEAEWEYAARGGTTTSRYWGESPEAICQNANVMNNATITAIGWPDSWDGRLICSGNHPFTMPVGSYPPNPFGLSDMIGNGWELVADCAHNTYDGAPTDGSAWTEPNCHRHVLRGGAFHSAPFFARSAAREGGQTDEYAGLGNTIRVVRDLDATPVALMPLPPVAKPVGDPVLGQKQFSPCTLCHDAVAGSVDREGPSLHGIFGKRAGANRPKFAYSEVLRKSGIVWNEETLDAWIKNPAVLVPHTLMSFAGITQAQTRANIVAYLKQESRPDSR